MKKRFLENLARALFNLPFQGLSEPEQRVIKSIGEETPIAENRNKKLIEQPTVGDDDAERVATFVGSWSFIVVIVVLAGWMLVNSFMLASIVSTFDPYPYPYILLSLALSTLAATQAPVIVMSQNRQAEKDKVTSTFMYEVSLKMDLEIMRLHQKIDAMSENNNENKANIGIS